VRLQPPSVPRRAFDGEETDSYRCRHVIVVNTRSHFRSSSTALVVAHRCRDSIDRRSSLPFHTGAAPATISASSSVRRRGNRTVTVADVIVVNAKGIFPFPVDVIDSIDRRSSLPFQRGAAPATISASSSVRLPGYEQLPLSTRHRRQRARNISDQRNRWYVTIADRRRSVRVRFQTASVP
jgi:hypothetical protein